MPKQELNKKLADKLNKFVGFQWLTATDGEYHWFDADKNIVGPTDEEGDIIWDMNACFKWLVPKVRHPIILSSAIGTDGVIRYSCLIEVYDVHPAEYGVSLLETPALALCKAIEKLIDSEQKNDRL